MKLDIFGWDILKKHFPRTRITKENLKEVLGATLQKEAKELIPSTKISNISIIFTTQEHIKELNKEFRKKDSVTDVLSFTIEEKPLKGEIYVCPEYIAKDYDFEEVIRAIVHGFLHLTGMEHEGYFTNDSENNEEMFVKQENILHNILYEVNNGIGKSRRKIS